MNGGKAIVGPNGSTAAGDPEPADPGGPGAEDAPVDADLFYALSILHMTVARVRKHLIEEGKSEHWMIFEELVLAPLVPGRVPKTRESLLAMFPGESPGFLDNRVTTVKRVFRRILPALIPADPTDALTPEGRFQELLEILQGSKTNRLWLAFLTKPMPGPDQSTASSLELAAPSSDEELPEGRISPEIVNDELRILLGFWLEMPLNDYLDDLEGAGPAVARALRDARPRGALGFTRRAAPTLNLHSLIDPTHPAIDSIPSGELLIVLERLKTYAKRVHRLAKQAEKGDPCRGAARRESSMPVEIAQVLYDLAGAGTDAMWRPSHRPDRRALPEERILAAQPAVARFEPPPRLLRGPRAARRRPQILRPATAARSTSFGTVPLEKLPREHQPASCRVD